jgi:hypothetical protein
VKTPAAPAASPQKTPVASGSAPTTPSAPSPLPAPALATPASASNRPSAAVTDKQSAATISAAIAPAPVTLAGVAEGERAVPSTAATDKEPATAVAAASPLPTPAREVPSVAVEYTDADRASLAEFQRSAMQLLRDNAQLQSVVLKVQAHDRTLHTLVGKTAECPKVVWFYPKKPELRDWLSDPMKRLFQAPLMMVVVCPVAFCVVPCGPDGVGWEVAMPKKWVKEWGPAILFSIYVMQAAVLAGRVVGIPLPPMPDTKVVKEALGLKGMLGSAFSKGVNQRNLSDSLSSFADTTKASLDLNPQLQSLCWGLKQPNAAADRRQALPADLPMHLVGEAYKSIHKFLITFGPLEDQLRGRMERVMAPDGDVEWVSVEGKEAWLQKHAAMVSEQQQPQAPLSVPLVSSASGVHPAARTRWFGFQSRAQRSAPQSSVPFPDSAPAITSASAKEGTRTWLAVKLAESGMALSQVAVCERGLVEQEGFITEASFATLFPADFSLEYLKGLGIVAKGTANHLVSLHRELHAQYTAASSPAPSTSSAADTVGLTPDEKARLLETQNTVQSLTAELKKLRVASAASQQQQQQSGGGGGGKGGLMQKQAQCNVVNPRTGQPYTMDELVAEIHLLQQQGARNAGDIAGVAAAAREGLEGLSPSRAAPTVFRAGERGNALDVRLFGFIGVVVAVVIWWVLHGR